MRKTLTILAILVPVALLAAPAAASQSKAEALIDQGFELIEKQHFAPAVKKLEKALKIGASGSFDAHLGIAVACNGLGEFDKAVEHARRATDLAVSAQQSVHAHNQLGVASFNQLLSDMRRGFAESRTVRSGTTEETATKRDWSVPEQAFRQVLELDPKLFPVARLSLAQVLGHQRRHKEALAELEIWEGTKPPPPPPHVRKAIDNLRCQAEASQQNPEGRLLEPGPEHPEIVKPQRRLTPAPKYTQTALKERTEGLVALEAVIDRQGDVVCVEVVSGLPNGLSESAEETVRGWKYQPATRGGEPVAVVYYTVVTFRLAKIRKYEDLVPD